MLDSIDKLLAPVAWIIAGALVIMLFVGPQVVAEDEAQPANAAKAAGASPYAAPVPEVDARQVFTDNCGSCHTLGAAGTSGSVGPNLDETTRDAAGVEEVVRGGSGSMPPFEGQLSDDEIAAVAALVAEN